jgi:hypothetical protein
VRNVGFNRRSLGPGLAGLGSSQVLGLRSGSLVYSLEGDVGEDEEGSGVRSMRDICNRVVRLVGSSR